MRNEKLIEAREQRCWTQAEVAEMIGVSRVTYARWEEQGVIPHPYAINKAREVFKMTPEQLGFRKYPSSSASSRHLTGISSTGATGATNPGTIPALFKLGVTALTLAQQLYGYTLDELLVSTEQELRRLDMMAQQHPEEKKTRREALAFLIELPLALMSLNSVEAGNSLSTLKKCFPRMSLLSLPVGDSTLMAVWPKLNAYSQPILPSFRPWHSTHQDTSS